METKKLRWTAGVTCMGLTKNDAIPLKFGAAVIAEKMRKLAYDYVLRERDFEVIGKGPRGCPKQR